MTVWFRRIIKNKIMRWMRMSNIERKMELAKEAVELIKEFGEEASIVWDNTII